MDIKANILETIGMTPMVRINRLSPNPAVNILAKVEDSIRAEASRTALPSR